MQSSRRFVLRPRRKLPLWLLFLYALLVLVFVTAGVGAGIGFGYAYSLPKIQILEDFRPDVITDIFADDSKVIGEFAIERRIIVSYEDIPPYMINAILAAE